MKEDGKRLTYPVRSVWMTGGKQAVLDEIVFCCFAADEEAGIVSLEDQKSR
jgi:hypothetical protein